jgi:hypothetical protein
VVGVPGDAPGVTLPVTDRKGAVHVASLVLSARQHWSLVPSAISTTSASSRPPTYLRTVMAALPPGWRDKLPPAEWAELVAEERPAVEGLSVPFLLQSLRDALFGSAPATNSPYSLMDCMWFAVRQQQIASHARLPERLVWEGHPHSLALIVAPQWTLDAPGLFCDGCGCGVEGNIYQCQVCAPPLPRCWHVRCCSLTVSRVLGVGRSGVYLCESESHRVILRLPLGALTTYQYDAHSLLLQAEAGEQIAVATRQGGAITALISDYRATAVAVNENSGVPSSSLWSIEEEETEMAMHYSCFCGWTF